MEKEKKNLPLYGVGPIIVFGQFIITLGTAFVFNFLDLKIAKFHILDIPFTIIGMLLVVFGMYLDISAKYKSKLFKKVAANSLITDGVYAIVRNPVYSGMLLICTGIVFIINDLVLFLVPVVCWAYMTIFLILTEEKWLKDLYGQEYMDYCKKVNRCIPWFPGRRG